MKFAYHGEKKVKIEAVATRRAPASSKPPPPKPPITFTSDKTVGKGKGKTGRSSDSKGGGGKGRIPKEKMIPEEKRTPGEKKPKEIPEGETLPKVEEEDRDDASIHYSPKTAREGNWGPANRRKEHSYRQRQSEKGWEYANGTWELQKNLKTEETATINSETRHLGFGEFSDWTYAEATMRKQRYAQFLLGEPKPNARKRKDSSIGFDTTEQESQWMSTRDQRNDKRRTCLPAEGNLDSW